MVRRVAPLPTPLPPRHTPKVELPKYIDFKKIQISLAENHHDFQAKLILPDDERLLCKRFSHFVGPNKPLYMNTNGIVLQKLADDVVAERDRELASIATRQISATEGGSLANKLEENERNRKRAAIKAALAKREGGGKKRARSMGTVLLE